MLIDTHAHLNFKAYDEDREEVIARCKQQPMVVINVGAQLKTSQQAVALADNYDNLYATVGLHPIHVFDETFNLQDYAGLMTDKVVAVGETGLDYWHFKHLREPYKFVLLHGWDGNKDEGAFIWLDEKLSARGHKVIRFNFPNASLPNQKKWLAEISKQVGYFNSKTVIIGFSMGAVSILRFLETIEEDQRIGAAFLLGAPRDNLGYPELSDFFKTDFNWSKIRQACLNFNVYSSSNDEVVPLDHGQALAKQLSVDLKIIPNAWHFSLKELPQLLDDIDENINRLKKDLPTLEQVIVKQKEVLIKQIELARQNNLPMMLHGRNGLNDRDVYLEMLDILKQEKMTRAVFHCFGGSLKTAQKIVSAGFYVGIDGPVTFKKKSEDLQNIVREILLANILIETDSPYLSPEPHRGERSEPMFVEFVAEKIAEIKGLSKEEVIKQTWQNAKKLFKI